MLITETLAIYSVEGILIGDESEDVVRAIEDYKSRVPGVAVVAGRRGSSVHSIAGFDVEETVAIYEPHGRIEIDAVPDAAVEILNAAVTRRLADIRRALPSVRRVEDWIYVEYGPGQFITPHADYAKNEDDPNHPKVAAINIQLNDEFEGGEFFVETCGSSRLWTDEGPPALLEGVDQSTEWFRSLTRTRWVSGPRKSTALIFGSQLVHGTNPISRGRSRKMISFLTA
jgi:hypothetical protein